jgi:hypothetical protein
MKKLIINVLILISTIVNVKGQFEDITFTGPGDVCYPQFIPIKVVNPVAGHIYDWYQYPNTSCGSTPVQLGHFDTVYNATSWGVYFFKIRDLNFMEIGMSPIAKVVRVMPAPGILLPAPSSNDGSSLTCHSSPAALCIPSGLIGPENGIGYPPPTTILKWYKDGQLFQVGGLPGVTAPGYYRYSINNGTCENYSDSVLVTLNPGAQVAPPGPVSICEGDSIMLSVTAGPGFTYQWKKGWNINIPGATASVYYAKKTSYNYSTYGYYCIVTSASCTNTSNYVYVSIDTFPSATVTPSGLTSFCSGGSVLLSANTGNGMTYQWEKNALDIFGATSSTYSAATAGSFTVRTTNSCGSLISAPINVNVNPLPNASILAGGTTTFCSGGNVVLNAPVAANRTYQWKKGANLISGATLSSYTATTGGNYRVIVTNTVTGCSKTTGSATVVTVNMLPSATITPQGSTTFCAGGSVVLAANTGTGLTYKWKKGSNYISGGTLSSYTVTLGGTYKVEVTNSNGCSKLSAGVVVSVPCREGDIISLKNNLDFNVYPNPNSGEFIIKFSNKPASPIQIELTDELGKVVKRFETSDETVVVNERNLANGINCLTAINKDEVVVRKINVVK